MPSRLVVEHGVSVFALDTQHSTSAMVSGRAAQAQPDKLAQPHAARSSIASAIAVAVADYGPPT